MAFSLSGQLGVKADRLHLEQAGMADVRSSSLELLLSKGEHLSDVEHQGSGGYLNVSVAGFYQMIKRYGLPHFRIGRRLKFRKVDIDKWIESRLHRLLAVVEGGCCNE